MAFRVHVYDKIEQTTEHYVKKEIVMPVYVLLSTRNNNTKSTHQEQEKAVVLKRSCSLFSHTKQGNNTIYTIYSYLLTK